MTSGVTAMSKGDSGRFSGTQGSPRASDGSPRWNAFPAGRSQLMHIFRNKSGHLADTPENRRLILELANDPTCFQGTDMWGNDWYARIDEDGSQLWAEVRNGATIRNCGRNQTPKPWNPETGLSGNSGKRGNYTRKKD